MNSSTVQEQGRTALAPTGGSGAGDGKGGPNAEVLATVALAGGAALVVFGAGLMMTHPGIRQLMITGLTRLMPNLEQPLKQGIAGMAPDLERYMNLRSM
jgi:hypothetical protein